MTSLPWSYVDGRLWTPNFIKSSRRNTVLADDELSGVVV